MNLEKENDLKDCAKKPNIEQTELVSAKMEQIKNEHIINHLDNEQKADYLRNVDIDDITKKGLSKTSFLQGPNPNKRNIIIDNGTGYFKAGFSGEEGPTVVFPAIVGRPKNASIMAAQRARISMLVLKPKIREVSLTLNTQLSMALSTTGTTWRKSGNTLTTNL